jgi:hypothetical protein
MDCVIPDSVAIIVTLKSYAVGNKLIIEVYRTNF